MESSKVFLDTDVILNWLCKEVESKTKFELWTTPYTILKKIEAGNLLGFTTLINMMEIIFVLRKKKLGLNNASIHMMNYESSGSQ